MSDFEGVDMDAAMGAVIEDMGQAAKRFKAQRYAPKPKPVEKPAAEPTQDNGPSLRELEAMIGE